MTITESRLVDTWAASMAQSWFLDASGQDRLTILGYSAGWASQIEAYQALRRVAARTLGVCAPQRDASLLARLKEWGWDRVLRWVGLRVVGATAVPPGTSATLLFFSEIPTPSMLDPLVAVARGFQGTAAAVSADPRAVTAWRATHLTCYGAWADARTVARLVRQGVREFDRRWAAIQRNPPQMRLGGRDLAGEVLPLLRRFLRWRTAWLPVEAAAIERSLRIVKPYRLVLTSDQHRLGRLGTEVARAMGVKTLVIQHGLPQDRIGYVPVVADAVACWSAHSKDWFVAQGTAAHRLVITGSPALEADTPPSAIGSRPAILGLLSPTVAGLNERLTRTLLTTAQRLGWPLTLKLHPGHRDWTTVRAVVAEYRGVVDVKVKHREPLIPLIDQSSVVVVHRSTTALQALARRRPVVVVLDAAAGSFSELDAPMLQLPSARTVSDLAAILAELAMPGRVEEYFSTRVSALEYVLGPCAGDSSERIAQAALGEAP